MSASPEIKGTDKLQCAHCRKPISSHEIHKFLTDLLSLPISDCDLGEYSGLSVLDALARVVGIRLLATEIIVTSDQLCICESCHGLLQHLFLAYDAFCSRNSYIVQNHDWTTEPRIPVLMDNSTQTNFPESDHLPSRSTSNEDILFYKIELDSLDGEELDPVTVIPKSDPEPYSTIPLSSPVAVAMQVTEISQSPVASPLAYSRSPIKRSRGRPQLRRKPTAREDDNQIQVEFRVPFVRIESSLRRLADLKMKGKTKGGEDKNAEFFNRWYDSMSLPAVTVELGSSLDPNLKELAKEKNSLRGSPDSPCNPVAPTSEDEVHVEPCLSIPSNDSNLGSIGIPASPEISEPHVASSSADSLTNKGPDLKTLGRQRPSGAIGARYAFKRPTIRYEHSLGSKSAAARPARKLQPKQKLAPKVSSIASKTVSVKELPPTPPLEPTTPETYRVFLSPIASDDPQPKFQVYLVNTSEIPPATTSMSNSTVPTNKNEEGEPEPPKSGGRVLRSKARVNYKEMAEAGGEKDTLDDDTTTSTPLDPTPEEDTKESKTENNDEDSDSIGESTSATSSDEEGGDQVRQTSEKDSKRKEKDTNEDTGEPPTRIHCDHPHCASNKKRFTPRRLSKHQFIMHNRVVKATEEESVRQPATTDEKDNNMEIEEDEPPMEIQCDYPSCASTNLRFTLHGISKHQAAVHGKVTKIAIEAVAKFQEERAQIKKAQKQHEWTCEVKGCGDQWHSRKFRDRTALNNHLRVWHPELPELVKWKWSKSKVKVKEFKCGYPGCQKVYKGKYNLKKHEKIGHLSKEEKEERIKRIFPCPQCNKRFSTSGTRNSHLIHTHSVERNLLCTKCGHAFKCSAALRSHMMIHANERSYKCKECGTGFNSYVGLKIHAFVHTDERPVTCEICGKGFKSKFNLDYHIIAHRNERLHKCPAPGCTADFNYKHHLRQHLTGSGNHGLDKDEVNRYFKNPESTQLFE